MLKKRVFIIGGVFLFGILVWVAIPKEKGPDHVETMEMAKSSSAAAAKPSAQRVSVSKLHEQARNFHKNGEFLEAQKLYQKILTDFPDYEDISLAQQEAYNLNLEVIFSNLPTPQSVVHEVKTGDSLGKIAQQYGTTIDLIKKSNNMKSDVVRLGQKLRIWTGKFNIFVDKSQNILMLKQGADVVKVYNVSTGANNSTPVGTYKIVNKLENPVWFNKGIVVPPESPENVLGTRWMGFDLPSYGIHGTIEPDAIGQQVTAGCVRMRNAEVEELYSIIPSGTEVTIAN